MLESLFTNVTVAETISCVINEIYQKNKLSQKCSKIIFKRLLYKLTTEVSFQFIYSLLKQANGCTMGDSLSVAIAYLYINRMETDIVEPTRTTDDTLRKCIIVATVDNLYDGLKNYHPKVKLNIETNPLIS